MDEIKLYIIYRMVLIIVLFGIIALYLITNAEQEKWEVKERIQQEQCKCEVDR